MHRILFLAIFVIFVFASCHSDVPGLPSPDEVKFCSYRDQSNKPQCKSTYEISEKDCISIKGNLFSDKDCTVPYIK